MILEYFKRFSQIPRGSFHEKKAVDFICDVARQNGLWFFRDSSDNLLVKIPGTGDRADEPAILLQGHTDMVCEKDAGCEHDFENDPLELYEEDGWIKARGTTLGADDGVAVAVMLCLMENDKTLLPSHPPIECLFTATEEVGLIGASDFDYDKGYITAKRMINMDGSGDGLIFAGCAGGVRTTLVCKYCLRDLTETEKKKCRALRIGISGLTGGHSGEDIHRGRENSIKLLGRLLLSASLNTELCLGYLSGGNKSNAIPREAEAMIITENTEFLCDMLKKESAAIEKELSAEDRIGYSFSVTPCELPDAVIPEKEAKNIIFLLGTAANGVFAMNHNVEGIPEFSRNLGVVRCFDEGRTEITFFSRSAMPSRTEQSSNELAAMAQMLGMVTVSNENYPGWDYAENSPMRDLYSKAYQKVCGKPARVTVIHAGLECGIIKGKLPHMDIISCGPEVLDLHSPRERLNINSFEQFFKVILEVLSSIQ